MQYLVNPLKSQINLSTSVVCDSASFLWLPWYNLVSGLTAIGSLPTENSIYDLGCHHRYVMKPLSDEIHEQFFATNDIGSWNALPIVLDHPLKIGFKAFSTIIRAGFAVPDSLYGTIMSLNTAQCKKLQELQRTVQLLGVREVCNTLEPLFRPVLGDTRGDWLIQVAEFLWG